MNKAVFLDRDGVINEIVYNSDFGLIDSPLNPEEFKILPGVGEAIKLINELGFLAVVVSNQPCVAKGKTSLQLMAEIGRKMEEELAKERARLNGVYYCFHHPDASQVKVNKYLADCACRKPKPGLLLQAARDLNIDLADSYMIGDGLTDVQAGTVAGCKTVLLGKPNHSWQIEMEKQKIKPDFIVNNLLEAVNIIKGQEEESSQ
ncbi:MAG: HAD family hydrolase [bacterium]